MNKKISPVAAKWTDDSIGRIWDWHNTHPFSKEMYFSLQKGRAITNLLTSSGMLHGNVLDFGCGAGDLLARLLELPLACFGTEYSSESAAFVNQRFKKHPRWKSCTLVENERTSYPDEFFDLITVVETLEHIPEGHVTPFFAELRRLVKPDGAILVTTPFNENLDRELVYCPFCETVFHRWQHVRSFTIESMIELVTAHEMHCVFCQEVDFNQFQSSPALRPLKYLNLAKTYHWLRLKKCIVVDRIARKRFLNSQEFRYRSTVGNRSHLCAFIKKNDAE